MRGELQPYCSNYHQWVPKVILLLALTLSASGCNLLRSTLELPEKGLFTLFPINQENDASDPVELQSELLRFADNAIEALNNAARKLQRDDDQAPGRLNLLKRRIAITTDILAIATGANSYANLLDMVIFASLNRMNFEDFWKPRFSGESAEPYQHASQEVEKEIWRIAETALKKEQIAELRAAILDWHKQHPDARSPRDLGSLGFASEISHMNRGPKAGITSSVFNLLSIDPLAGLDPATRELASSRLFAERGLFLARHLPTLIRWEAELLIIQTAEMPQMEKLLASSAQVAESADRFSQTAETLPGLISTERQQIVQALNEQQPGLVSLAKQTEDALSAGKLMSDASNAALKSFQDVVRQLQSRPSNPDAEPFRINEYTAAAAQINATSLDLVKLLQTFDQTLAPGKLDALSAQVETLTRKTQTSGKELVDYAFRQTLLLGLILIGSACGMVLASAVVFWRLKKKFA
ncbi:MAG: hypothetical protein Q7U98_00915 [Methylicorpusculum sp.]|nr:hypothetical protein [Methylicorpusculum sp.]MDO8937701.1 hypothetical protein [Methylicorpusculum sp.]MDP2180019.1 hypothetical protein [Methylicorpusculum sp.]MDP2202837.1 hypothetical protein [Methylicorpusculum sp.]MDP3528659.1 hypothetical protein [Methylicorpusculum sp.]MDZ4150917.1 hypothetical protein [Methylicorpusculum sp.]